MTDFEKFIERIAEMAKKAKGKNYPMEHLQHLAMENWSVGGMTGNKKMMEKAIAYSMVGVFMFNNQPDEEEM